jgi:hypothetical protein
MLKMIDLFKGDGELPKKFNRRFLLCKIIENPCQEKY